MKRRDRGRRGEPLPIVATLVTAGVLSWVSLVRAQEAAPSPPSTSPFAGEEVALGDPSAPVTVVEYLSTTCVHCAAFNLDTWPRVKTDLLDTGRVRWIIRELPTAPVAVSTAGFMLARCKGQEGYWPAVERLLEAQSRIVGAATTAAAIEIEAAVVSLSRSETTLCLSDGAQIEAANARRAAALAQGVDSTPFFLIAGAPLRPGARLAHRPYQGGELSWSQLVDAVAKAKTSSAAPAR